MLGIIFEAEIVEFEKTEEEKISEKNKKAEE